MEKLGLLLLTLCSAFYISAQEPISINADLSWKQEAYSISKSGGKSILQYHFDQAIYTPQNPGIPYFYQQFPLRNNAELQVTIVNVQYEPIDLKLNKNQDLTIIKEELGFLTGVQKDRLDYTGSIQFIPIRKRGSSYEKVTSFELKITAKPLPPIARRRDPLSTTTSQLSDGQLYKIAIPAAGIYKLTYNFLKDELNIDIDNIDPRQIKILGNGGGMLPDENDLARIDDVEEYAIYINGEDDGSFDANDFILLYANGPHRWFYNASSNSFQRETNVYDLNNHLFIKISGGNGKRVSQVDNITSTDFQVNTFLDYLSFEEDQFNLLNDYSGAQGSGILWYGDRFNPTRERTYSNFTFPNLDNSQPASIRLSLAGRGPTNSSLQVQVANETYTRTLSRVDLDDSEDTFARIATISESFLPSGDQIDVNVNYPVVGNDSEGWLDFIEINAFRQLTMSDNVLAFRHPESADYATTSYTIANANNNLLVWDISSVQQVIQQAYTINGNSLSFGDDSDILREYIVFDPSAEFSSPIAIGEVANQNLHSIEGVDMLIVYHSDFAAAAQRLASHRQQFSGLNVALAEINQLYNEFSGGSVDPTAIRDMAKMLYDRDPQKFRFLLLLGDGSFDIRNITNLGTNFIPSYQYEKSERLNPILVFPSDDYFALLSDGEGGRLEGAMDIGVGRLPVKTAEEADVVIDKIIRYDTDEKSFRDWRNRMVFVADDEDGNIHINDADEIAVNVQDNFKDYNVNKIYFDAFKQESTPGGTRFPSAKAALNRDVFKGALVVNYLGHGGPKGWAQERVLRPEDVNSWTNRDALTVFITATCSFTGFDDPKVVTAGELCLLNPNGGAVGLLTTVRAVYASSNARLTGAVFDAILGPNGAKITPIGEIMRTAKNAVAGINSRKFFTIADPAMFLAVPKYEVTTTTINGKNVDIGFRDTLSALERVTIEGAVRGNNGQILTDFNGTVYPTIYDKYITISTLVQDVGPRGSRPKDFKLQKNIIFKGAASVRNGVFSFSFVVPKDINYNFGNGKISYYAKDGQNRDAHGFYEGITIGGADPNAAADDQPPLVEVFMDDENFAFGGITSEDPVLFVKLSDDNGINVAGNSIGHDLTGVLDEDTQGTFVLNDFYESELDDYTAGKVRFPIFDLEEGRHSIRVKAWDIANNSAEGYTEFIVTGSAKAALDMVLNYPNPFTTNTQFQFGHNLTGNTLDIQVQILTVSGRLVKTIEAQRFAEGNRITDIAWDGRDEYGDRLARGVYLYKVKVKSAEESGVDAKSVESDFEKLVILK